MISTDVDKLIRTVAERKRIPLSELQQQCRIDKKNMDKWTRVLEDEGYITIEYGIRGTYVIWSGGDTTIASTESKEKAKADSFDDTWQDQRSESVQERSQIETAENTESETLDEREPEELLSKYLERKKTTTETDPDTVKSSILSSIKEGRESKDAKDDPGKDISAEVAEAFERSGAKERGDAKGTAYSTSRIPTDIYEHVSASSSVDTGTSGSAGTNPESTGAVASRREEPRRKEGDDPKTVFGKRSIAIDLPSRQRQVVSSENRDMLNSYLEEINREKSEIAELKRQKDELYRERLLPLETQMEADIVAFTQRIMDKHAKISELQERVLEFPGKVGELEGAHAEVSKAMEEGKTTLNRTSKRLDEVMEELKYSKAELSDKIDEIRSTIGAECKKIGEIETVSAETDERIGKLNGAISLVKGQMDSLAATISSLSGELNQVSRTKNELGEMTLSIKGTVSNHNEELSSLEGELEELAKVEGWFSEYVDDYEKKIAEIEQYVVRNEQDLTELQESAETAHMKKYLTELESMTESYQKELEGALSEEKDIETRISGSKEKVGQMIRESSEMIRNMREGAPIVKDFDSLRRSLAEKAGSMKAKVHEKAKERARLKEDSGKARKTRGVKHKAHVKTAVRNVLKSVPKKSGKKPKRR